MDFSPTIRQTLWVTGPIRGSGSPFKMPQMTPKRLLLWWKEQEKRVKSVLIAKVRNCNDLLVAISTLKIESLQGNPFHHFTLMSSVWWGSWITIWVRFGFLIFLVLMLENFNYGFLFSFFLFYGAVLTFIGLLLVWIQLAFGCTRHSK